MKLSKDLNDALEAISKEVDSWPAWKRSIDMHEVKREVEPPHGEESAHEKVASNRKTARLARAAGA